jgi:hypothetical protein
MNMGDGVPLGGLNWGDLRRQQPVSDKWGFDRGQPVDRYHIENFLQRHAADIRGKCIEVMNGAYVKRFGGGAVEQADVIDINTRNANATIVGDLVDPATLPHSHYDCFVLTQTLPVIFDCAAVIRNGYAALRPGGVMLITAPCLCRYSPHPEDFWRFTDKSLSRLIAENSDAASVEVESYGNLVSSIAFLVGLASGELEKDELEHRDARFPLLVSARVCKPGEG